MIRKSIVGLAVCLLLLSATHARAERMCSIIAEGAISNEQMCFADSSSINVSIPTGETSKTPAAAIQLEPSPLCCHDEFVDCDGGPACIPSAGWSDLQQCLYWVNFGRRVYIRDWQPMSYRFLEFSHFVLSQWHMGCGVR